MNKKIDELSGRDETIKDQSETLHLLEGIVERTSNRYASMVENERRRLETNVDVGIQVATPLNDFCQQADFMMSRQGKVDHHWTRGQEVRVNVVELNK